MKITRTLLLSLCVWLTFSSSSQAQEAVKPFVKSSLEQILTKHQGQAFVLSFWSLDCRYCNEEFALFKSALTTHKNLVIELVATDDLASRDLVQARLEQAGLAANSNWIFAENGNKLRFHIDKNWYGELPRTYFFNKDGSVRAQSGKIDDSDFKQWLAHNL